MNKEKTNIGIGKLKEKPVTLEVTKSPDQLTDEELKILINLVGQAQCPVAQAQKFIDLINKMSKMVDEVEKKV